MAWCRWRPWVQAVCLAGFVGLALATVLGLRLPLPADLFLRLDPLLWVTNTVASRAWAPYGVLALAAVVVTALLGRVFCGWVCPLGTVLDAVATVQRQPRVRKLAPRLLPLRFAVLAAVLGAAVVGVNLAGWVDPLALSMRVVHALPRPQTSLPATALAAGLMLGVIGLVWVAPRFWCRVLCPLGAFLSIASRLARWRPTVSALCQACGQCGPTCPMGQSPRHHSPARCIGCRRCQAACPKAAVWFQFSLRAPPGPMAGTDPESVDAGRRLALWSLGGLVLGSAVGLSGGRRSESAWLRPPGAQREELFLARCVGCGACLSACPTGGLKPVLALGRLEALFTPRLVPRVGPCQPDCTACGEVCFSGAIARFAAEQKPRLRIGVAVIDRSRCLPWAEGQRCVVCVNACPPQYGAIQLQPIAPGQFRPVVLTSRCPGCGLCEYRCPLPGQAAIQVVAAA